MERVSVFFCLLLLVHSFFFFCLLLSFLMHFVTCILRKSVSLFLSLSTFQVINMGFLNEMWYKGLIQRILGCGDFFFPEKAKDLVIWLDFMSFQPFLLYEKLLEIICCFQFSIKGINNLGRVLYLLGGHYSFFFPGEKATLYNILVLLGALLQVGALSGGLNGL